jgi:hypothetical protein
MEDRRGAFRVLIGIPNVKDPHGKPGRGERTILKWIFEKWVGEARTVLIWLRIGVGGGLL